METAIMNDKPKKPKGTVGGGRAPGQRNILPPLEKSARATLQAMLGFSDSEVARTGMLNGKGISARQRLFETLHGLRPATPKEFMDALRFVWDRGIGLPTKMRDDIVQRPPLIFASQTGYLPYDSRHPANREMDARSAALNAANDEEIRILALEKAKPEVLAVESKADEEPALEIVRESDLPGDHGARGR
jgi:hypothetical protein